MMSNRTRNVKNILDRLNALQYYTCRGEGGAPFLASTMELLPHEVSTLKYVLRKEILSRRQDVMYARAAEMKQKEVALHALLRRSDPIFLMGTAAHVHGTELGV